MSSAIPLLLFAKAPIAGKVKTRLQTHCSPAQCAAIAQILLSESVKRIIEDWPGKIYLSVWLDKEHTFIRTLCEQYGIELTDQSPGDLGAKMHHALESFGYPGAIIGADAPHMKPTELHRAHSLLLEGKSVVGVSQDGGYYFIGLSKSQPQLFNDMPWGSAEVLPETLRRARSLNLELTPLDPLRDVDEWQDLLLAAKQLPALAEYLQQQGLLGS